MSGTVGCEKEDNMEQMIVCAMALVVLRWWASAVPLRMLNECVCDVISYKR